MRKMQVLIYGRHLLKLMNNRSSKVFRNSIITLIYYLVISVIFFNCSNDKPAEQQEVNHIENKSESAGKVEIHYAKGFTVRYFPGYRLISVVNQFAAQTDTTHFLLLNKGESRPEGYKNSIVIHTPVERVVAMSTVHVGLLDFLESTSALVGVENLNYVYSEEVHKAFKDGKISEVGRNMSPDYEKIISLQPDVVIGVGGTGPSQYHQLESVGMPVIVSSEWVEESPLAKAEWVKLIAVLLNKESLVNEKFDIIANEYNRLKNLANDVTDKRKILTGINLKDVWYMPKGDNYMAVFLKDAGADYPLSNEKGKGSTGLSFEAVYPMAMEVDCWVNLGGVNINGRSELLAQDSRYADFRAFKEDRIYDYSNRINSRGANDFWESAGIRPDLVLADLIHILHPELLPNHQLYYYRQLK